MADPATIAKLAEVTTFTAEEITNMYVNFKKLSASVKDDNLIDAEEFRDMMACHGGSVFIDGLFRMFDRDNSGGIDFVEFVTSLAIYQGKARNVNDQEKQRLFFKIYDADGDGEISQNDLKKMLNSCFQSNFMEVAETDVNELVQATFQKYDVTARGTIDFASYAKNAFSHKSGYL
ncbi:calcium-binding protein, putative [Bodo saltans]|uniref:Calcium-binding protein, putative n=1 Tax=Bodo saltans TaxID=75058 RepID=A0A0S4JWF5_BODSA|nr:calcium-binding protein, putative [Bodo saltans]|eukprot:CUG93465.1 calcium-binding protein, putative [Bodo saltans]